MNVKNLERRIKNEMQIIDFYIPRFKYELVNFFIRQKIFSEKEAKIKKKKQLLAIYFNVRRKEK